MIYVFIVYFLIMTGTAECMVDWPRNKQSFFIAFGMGWILIPARILAKLSR